MNAPRRDVTAGHRNHLPTTCLRLAARGLANGQWFSVGPETLNAVMARTGLPATERDQVAELSSQVDGWALRGRGAAPEVGVMRLKVEAETGPAFTLDRRRGDGEGWEFRLWTGNAPTEGPIPPSLRSGPRPTSAPRWLRPERVVSGVERSAARDDDEQPLQEAAVEAGTVEASAPATDEPTAEASAVEASAVEASAVEASAVEASAPSAAEAPGKPACSHEGCDAAARSRGMCNVHYNRDLRKQRAAAKEARRAEAPPKPTTCATEGCTAPIKTRGLCHRCHNRAYWQANADRLNQLRTARNRGEALPARLDGDPAIAADLAVAVREAEAKADALITAAEAKAAALVAEAQRKADELRATACRDAEGLRAQARRVAGAWSVVCRGPNQQITVVMRLDPGDAPVCRASRDASGWAVSVWPPGRSPAPEPVQLRAQTMSAALHLGDLAAAGFGWRLLSSPRTGAVGPAEVQP